MGFDLLAIFEFVCGEFWRERIQASLSVDWPGIEIVEN